MIKLGMITEMKHLILPFSPFEIQIIIKNYISQICREQKGEKKEVERLAEASRNTSIRNRKSNKSIRFKSDKASPNSRQGSIKSHHTPSPYMVCNLIFDFLSSSTCSQSHKR